MPAPKKAETKTATKKVARKPAAKKSTATQAKKPAAKKATGKKKVSLAPPHERTLTAEGRRRQRLKELGIDPLAVKKSKKKAKRAK